MIRLMKHAIPVATLEEPRLRFHPSFCGICLNLSCAVAEECNGIREKLNGGETYLGWQSWDFEATFGDLLVGISDGCASCQLIKEAIDGVFPGAVVWDDEIWNEKEVSITMLKGNILTLWLRQFPDDNSSGTIELYADNRRWTPLYS